MSILFVSHKLEDVELLCSAVAVLRSGKLVGTSTPPYDTGALVRMMFEREVTASRRIPPAPGAAVLSLRGVSLEAVRLQITDVSFERTIYQAAPKRFEAFSTASSGFMVIASRPLRSRSYAS